MTMLLEIRETNGPGKLRWTMERGRRSLGRGAACDWHVEDGGREMSKLHCTIERDREGFLLRDESANGTRVDDAMVLEGEMARLRDGSRLQFGGRSFTVRITGDPDRDMEDPDRDLRLSDETVTVSSILADIAPGGHSARGVLGGREADDWSSSARTKGNAPSSRNVDIGWSGPPQTGSAGFLPTDWNNETDSDYASRLEHGVATQSRMATMPARKLPAVEPQAEPAPQQSEPAAESAPRTGGGQDAALARARATLGEIELAMSELFAMFEVEPDERRAMPDRMDENARFAARLEALLMRQTRFNTALERLLSELSQTLEPRILEARVDAEPRRMPLKLDSRYWHAYRNLFTEDGKDIAFRDLVTRMMARKLDARANDNDDARKANEQE